MWVAGEGRGCAHGAGVLGGVREGGEMLILQRPYKSGKPLAGAVSKAEPGRLVQLISCRNRALLSFGRALLDFALGLAL